MGWGAAGGAGGAGGAGKELGRDWAAYAHIRTNLR